MMTLGRHLPSIKLREMVIQQDLTTSMDPLTIRQWDCNLSTVAIRAGIYSLIWASMLSGITGSPSSINAETYYQTEDKGVHDTKLPHGSWNAAPASILKKLVKNWKKNTVQLSPHDTPRLYAR